MKKLFKSKLFRFIIIVFILLLAFVIYYIKVVTINPPETGTHIPLSLKKESVAPGIYTCKSSWIRKNRFGIYEMFLEGNPYEMGLINGILTKDLLYYQEKVFVDRLREMIPTPAYLNFLKYIVAWFNRDMDQYIPLEYKQEIYGISKSASPEYDFIAPNYHRILNYHAAHDIGHAMQNMNIVGCTAFAAWGSKSEDSSLIVGRNFDFYMGEEFSRNKIVVFLHPDKGYRLMMITWGGMTGVVSGMNEKGLTITLNSAKSNISWKAKMPVSLLARMILQYASNIPEAIKIARENQTFVSESFLIASASENRAVVIEKSPDKTGVYSPVGSSLVVTNHFQSETFSHDKLTLESMAESASPYRYKRVEELLKINPLLNPLKAAAILRDKNGLNNADIGLGNEKAINQLIAHHSVIFKPKQRLVWVSSNPYQEGEYVCYDLYKVFDKNLRFNEEIDEQNFTIPVDSFYKSTEWDRYLKYKQKTEWIKRKLNHNESGFLSQAEIEEYLGLNPNYFYPHFIIGRYYDKMELYGKAILELKTSLQKEIPRKVDHDEVEELLKKIQKKHSQAI